MKPRVDILMSTYNGEKYVAEQIESILSQTYADIRLTIRDDGSKDGTTTILSRYAKSDDRIQLILQENLGVVGSFYRLLQDADPAYQFFAFADQDDVWRLDKVERAVQVLTEYDSTMPLLYCAGLEYVSANLTHVGYSQNISKTPSLNNALVQNIAQGCTIVINKVARELLLKHAWPPQVMMHDWWLYVVVSAFGKVVRDDFISMKYRQHGTNVVGGTVSFLSDFRKRVANFISRNNQSFFGCYTQAYGFWRSYEEDLIGEKRNMVRLFIDSKHSLFSRIKYLTSKQRVYRQTPVDDVILQLLILLNKY